MKGGIESVGSDRKPDEPKAERRGPIVVVGVGRSDLLERLAVETHRDIQKASFLCTPTTQAKYAREIRRSSEMKSTQIVAKLTEKGLLRQGMPDRRHASLDLLATLNNVSHIVLIYRSLFAGRTYWIHEKEPHLMIRGKWRTGALDILNATYSKRVIQGVPDLDDHETELRRDYLEELRTLGQSYKDYLGWFRLRHGFPKLTEDEAVASIQSFIREIKALGLRIEPYDSLAEARSIISDFLVHECPDIVLRLYVRKDIATASEVERLTDLFWEYLREAFGNSVTLGRRSYANGTLYEFTSLADGVDRAFLQRRYEDFETFLKQCQSGAPAAVAFVESLGHSPESARLVVDRFAREYGRVILDLNYKKQMEIASLEHSLRCQALELGGQTNLTPHVRRQDQAVGTRGEVRRVNGGQPPDVLLMLAINTRATGLERIELISALDIVKAEDIPKPERRTALSRLSEFIKRHSGKLEDLTVKVIAEYLERLTKR